MSLLIYGANGYTGELCARRAAAEGLPTVLAGRRADVVQALATELGRPHLAFALDRPAAVDAALAGVTAVLNCAGPFSRTAAQLVAACLRAKAHYLDITGELDVLEKMAGRDEEARAAGITLLPGAGFDVVPSDCLAAHLKRRL
ncbi:MAG TPA: saccharopine dehydrogenase NADP-binding domain-containing protein, partial [Polyangia bacterium]|nr:saccharopine dehydrogenase NADP-binding domain-containing protein [Polyangia bacterium]